jgi:hypothetical protein
MNMNLEQTTNSFKPHLEDLPEYEDWKEAFEEHLRFQQLAKEAKKRKVKAYNAFKKAHFILMDTMSRKESTC